MHASSRNGFALPVVLAVLVSLAALGIASGTRARAAVQVASNRIALTRGAWLAEGCIERARAAMELALVPGDSLVSTWNRLDEVLARSVMTSGCRLLARPSGTTLDVNHATVEELTTAFTYLGRPDRLADSLAAALLDWRDGDDVPRPAGAERDWYRAAGRLPPRDAPFAATEEFSLVRGLERDSAVLTLLGVESARVLLDRAPLAVVAGMPGMSVEAVGQLADRRRRGEAVRDLAVFANTLSPDARANLLAHYVELQSQTTMVPEWWTVEAIAAGDGRVESHLEIRILLLGGRAVVVRRRNWP